MLLSRLTSMAGNTVVRSLSTSSVAMGGSGNYVHLQGSSSRKMALLKMQHSEQDKKGGKGSDLKAIADADLNTTDAAALTYTPEEQLMTRTARIFRPAKTAMQSGHFNTKKWKVEFENKERWENSTIGWCSNADPLSNISMALAFKTKEDAIEFVERQGYQCYVDENPPKVMQPKLYGVNFSWNKRVRRGMK